MRDDGVFPQRNRNVCTKKTQIPLYPQSRGNHIQREDPSIQNNSLQK